MSQPRILFLTLSDDVGSERIVCEMSRRGAVCAVLGRPSAIAFRSRRVAHRHALPSRCGLWGAAHGAARRIEALAADWRPDAVIPLDDMAAQLLRDLASVPRTSESVRRLVETSLGDPLHYATASCRGLLVEAAAALGVLTPAQRRAADLPAALAAAEDLRYPLMLKRENTCGGMGVVLVEDATALAEAFGAADRRARAKRALRRFFGFRPVGEGAALTLQAHVAGSLAIRTVACRGGRVLSGLSLEAERLDPPVTGSSTVVRPLHHAGMVEAARRVVAALGCSGFVSFDFILAPDGRAHLIEMNARPVGSGHLGARFGHDLYGIWLARFPGFADADPPRPAETARPVALFPKEMGRDPGSPCFAPGAAVVHDVPWDEPGVVAAYRDALIHRHPDRAATISRILSRGIPTAEVAQARRRFVASARLWGRAS